MSKTASTGKNDEERRRGALYFILFFLFSLLIGGLYWVWLTFGNQGGSPELSVTAPAMIAPASSDGGVDAPMSVPDARGAAATDTMTVAPETEPEAEAGPEPAPTLSTEPAEQTPAPTPASLFNDPRWQQTAIFHGIDAAGNTAEFSAYILSGANAWAFGRSEQLDIGGRVIPLSTFFSDTELTSSYCDQSAMIALGAASFEGDVALNHRLAGGRGLSLVSALGAAGPACAGGQDPARLFVNLGEHRQTLTCPDNAARCPEISASQRPVVLISGASHQADTDYGTALKNAITAYEAAGRQIFPGFRLADYSRFEVNH